MIRELSEKASVVYTVAQAVILAMSVGMVVWLANVVIAHGNTLASQGAHIAVNTERLKAIETLGSAGLQRHERDDDTRINAIKDRLEKIEAAILALQAAPGELKAINTRLDAIQKGQDRIEKTLDEHMRISKP